MPNPLYFHNSAERQSLAHALRAVAKTPVPDEAASFARVCEAIVHVAAGRFSPEAIHPTIVICAALALATEVVELVKDVKHWTEKSESLAKRQDELLATVVKVSRENPYPDEVKGWIDQRGKLVAEVGTLKARIAELERADRPLSVLALQSENDRLKARVADLERDLTVNANAWADSEAECAKLRQSQKTASDRIDYLKALGVSPGEECGVHVRPHGSQFPAASYPRCILPKGHPGDEHHTNPNLPPLLSVLTKNETLKARVAELEQSSKSISDTLVRITKEQSEDAVKWRADMTELATTKDLLDEEREVTARQRQRLIDLEQRRNELHELLAPVVVPFGREPFTIRSGSIQGVVTASGDVTITTTHTPTNAIRVERADIRNLMSVFDSIRFGLGHSDARVVKALEERIYSLERERDAIEQRQNEIGERYEAEIKETKRLHVAIAEVVAKLRAVSP